MTDQAVKSNLLELKARFRPGMRVRNRRTGMIATVAGEENLPKTLAFCKADELMVRKPKSPCYPRNLQELTKWKLVNVEPVE